MVQEEKEDKGGQDQARGLEERGQDQARGLEERDRQADKEHETKVLGTSAPNNNN